MFILKNNFKCFISLQKTITKQLLAPINFQFASKNKSKSNSNERLANFEKMKKKKLATKKENNDIEPILSSSSDIENDTGDNHEDYLKIGVEGINVKEGEIIEDNLSDRKALPNPTPKLPKAKPKPSDLKLEIRGKVQPYFLNKSNPDTLTHETFSVTKLMEYNSEERKQKLDFIQSELLLNKDLKRTYTKAEIRRNFSLTAKSEIVREMPKNL
jgi:hypothetical protein